MHCCRSPAELRSAFADAMQAVVGTVGYAVLLNEEAGGRHRVEVAGGDGCPLVGDDYATSAQWPVPAEQRLPLRYGSHVLGELLVGEPLPEACAGEVQALLIHYATALVNLTLHAESRQATDHYCASLQALEEGIVLFQEEDPDAVLARLLSLTMAMVQATAGVLYVLDEVGDATSALRLDQVLGLPEQLLSQFVTVDGSAWPQCLLSQGAQRFERQADGSLAGLSGECLPTVVTSLVSVPLRYHGVDAGLCVLFNAAFDDAAASDYLGRVQSLGRLGAALLHRLRLEALTARNRSIARELEIAKAIQQRLLPARAPDAPQFDFAWRSIAAQHIGGDYLDLLCSDTGHVYAVVADASGHGIDSAMLMTSFRSTYRADAPWQDPEMLLASMNGEVVHEVGATGMFITAATLRIDSATKQVTLSSAGHNPVFLFRKATGAVEAIESHGPALGFVAGASYTKWQTVLGAGDILLLYTDGITEAADASQQMFGEERLAALLRHHSGAAAGELLDALQQALHDFTGRASYDDDVSLTVIKVN